MNTDFVTKSELDKVTRLQLNQLEYAFSALFTVLKLTPEQQREFDELMSDMMFTANGRDDLVRPTQT